MDSIRDARDAELAYASGAMRKRNAAAILFAVLTLLAAGCARSADRESAANGSLAREEVPNVRLASLAGGQLAPEDLKGQVVLYDFWATWCPPCHVQARVLDKLYPEYKGRGVEFLAVSVGEAEETVRKFVDKRPFDYPVLLDPRDKMSTALDVYVLPTVVITNGEGKILFLESGISSASQLTRVLDRALADRGSVAL